MLVSDIIDRAQTQAEETYDAQTWIDFVNLALDDLTPIVKQLNTKRDIAVTLGNAAVAATATIGSGDNGTVTITADTAGVAGNLYTVTVSGDGASDCALSATLVGTDITVVLGKTGAALEPTKNTATLVAAAVGALTGVTAAASGTGASSLTAAEDQKNFTGGVNANVSGNGSINIAADADLSKAHEFLNVYFKPTGGIKTQLKGPLPISNIYTRGWKQTAIELILQQCGSVATGTVDVDFYKKLTHVTDVNDTPEVPDQYHNLLILYCCAKAQQKEEELNDKNDFYSEYTRGKNGLALERIWQMEPQNRKYIRKARIAALIGGASQ
jgi:hypothetical protein